MRIKRQIFSWSCDWFITDGSWVDFALSVMIGCVNDLRKQLSLFRGLRRALNTLNLIFEAVKWSCTKPQTDLRFPQYIIR